MSTEGLKEADQRFMLAVISMKGTLSAEEREQIAVVTGSTENAVRLDQNGGRHGSCPDWSDATIYLPINSAYTSFVEMPSIWSAEEERQMLIHVIDTIGFNPDSAIWPGVSDKMGGAFTASAIRQKFYKLKKESEKLISSSGDAPAPPVTPRKRSTATPKKPTTGGKRKRNDAKSDETVIEDDDNMVKDEVEEVAEGVKKKVKVEESAAKTTGYGNGIGDGEASQVGETGDAATVGENGTNGDAGAKGKDGETGTNGENADAAANGKSVEVGENGTAEE